MTSQIPVLACVVGLLVAGMLVKAAGGVVMDAWGIPGYAVVAGALLIPVFLFCRRVDRELLESLQKRVDKCI